MKRRDFVKAAGLASMSGAMLSTIPTAKAAVEVTSPVRAEGRRTDARAASTDNIVFPSDALAVVDVTKAPYHCDNSGERDCTAALIRALDDLVRPTLLAQRALEEEMARDPRRIVFPGGEGPREYDSYAKQYFVPLYVGYR